jgi:hypothetical protein
MTQFQPMLPIIFYLSFIFPAQQFPVPTFTAQTIDSTISIGYGLALGDVDGDKKTDILLADKKQIVWYRNPDWKKTVIAENLTEFDNVCIAARDLDGDGKVEVAVGAQWNPGETGNDSLSGAVFFLKRPSAMNSMWQPVKLYHEPTVHRMRWVKSSDGKYYLIVLPLHGRGNKGGEGAGVKVLAYEYRSDANGQWRIDTLANEMHMTHNMAIDEVKDSKTNIYVAGKEGVKVISEPFGGSKKMAATSITNGSGEVRVGKNIIATIQPMHGNTLAIYTSDKPNDRKIIDSSLNEGHALAVADFSNAGYEQVVAGWRVPNKEQAVGIKLYHKKSPEGNTWESAWVDKNGMACEDLQVADLNNDGKPDIIAAGRSTRNVKIYWNK